ERLHKLMTLNPSGRGLLAYLQEDASLSPAGQRTHYLEFLKNAEKMRPDSPRILCRLGVAEIAEGQTQEGLALVKRALQPSLPYDDALATARALHAHGQDQLALQFYQLASSLPEAKTDARAALGEARTWLLLGHPHKALETLNSLPAAARPVGEAADLAGLIYARLGMNRRALASFSVAIRLNPKEESFYRDAAIFLGSHGQWDAALKELDNAMQQTGSSTSLLLDDAVLLQLSGRREQAQVLLKKLAIHADDPTLTSQQRQAALLLAISYYTTNQKPDAARIFRQLTQSDPKLAVAWYYRALMASESGKTSQAVQWLSRCLAVEPKYARALYLRGKLLASEGKLVEARSSLEAAAAADPSWSAPHYQLVQVFRRLKKPDIAANEAKAVQQLDARSHGAQSVELREYLDSLTLPSEQGYRP
ncbi:MAG TPA: tetratricopeptide repeat protein, partial [Terriglobia bacterium]|nr:tetratricopeptide repeat protein [Terriglobia bacterium]